ALFKLDQFIEQQVVPLYYGRYVDDILLVMENTSKINNTESFWNWIFSRDGGELLFGKSDNKADGKDILFKTGLSGERQQPDRLYQQQK
ncbi:MAG: hypothetical protein LRY40_05215, partial [Shewanella fodinae]|nr:hypothetical protein [Shewanella fodinae]